MTRLQLPQETAQVVAETASNLITKGRAELSERTQEANGRAVALFERAIALEPHFAPAYVELAAAFLQRAEERHGGRWLERAIAAGEKAIELDPLPADGYLALGRAYRSKGSLKKEQELWQRRVQLVPGDAIARMREGWVLWFTGRPAEAVQWLNAAAAHKSGDPQVKRWVYFFLGNVKLALSKQAEAERLYRMQLDTHPDHSSAQAGLIWSLLAAHKDTEARSQLTRFQTNSYDGDRYPLKLADIEYFLGEDENALEHARQSLCEPDERYWPRGFLASTILGALLWSSQRGAAIGQLAASEQIDRERLDGGDEGYMPHIDLAAIEAVRGDASKACRSLRAAIAAGWRYRALAVRDRLFEGLRRDPEFISLMTGGVTRQPK